MVANTVLTTAGATALTRTRGASSSASWPVRWISAALLAPYTPIGGDGRSPATDATLTTAAPGCSPSPARRACSTQATAAATLTANVFCTAPRSADVTGPAT